MRPRRSGATPQSYGGWELAGWGGVHVPLGRAGRVDAGLYELRVHDRPKLGRQRVELRLQLLVGRERVRDDRRGGVRDLLAEPGDPLLPVRAEMDRPVALQDVLPGVGEGAARGTAAVDGDRGVRRRE